MQYFLNTLNIYINGIQEETINERNIKKAEQTQ